MYSVEYRRFYLRDLESIVVWPNPSWWLRLALPAMLLGALGVIMWQWASITFGFIFGILGLLWVILEVALGPTAKSRLRVMATTIDIPLVMRTRRADSVLAKIDAALRATRANEQPTAAAATIQSAEPSVQGTPEASSTPSIAAASQTNAS